MKYKPYDLSRNTATPHSHYAGHACPTLWQGGVAVFLLKSYDILPLMRQCA